MLRMLARGDSTALIRRSNGHRQAQLALALRTRGSLLWIVGRQYWLKSIYKPEIDLSSHGQEEEEALRDEMKK